MAFAGILNIIGVVVCVIVFLHTMGTAFVTAGFGGGMPAELRGALLLLRARR